MKIFYCTVSKPSNLLLLNVQDITGPRSAAIEAQTVEDFHGLIADHKVDAVMFYFFGWPRRPVAVNHPKLDYWLRKLVKDWNK